MSGIQLCGAYVRATRYSTSRPCGRRAGPSGLCTIHERAESRQHARADAVAAEFLQALKDQPNGRG